MNTVHACVKKSNPVCLGSPYRPHLSSQPRIDASDEVILTVVYLEQMSVMGGADSIDHSVLIHEQLPWITEQGAKCKSARLAQTF